MRKTVIDPTAGDELVADTDVEGTAYSRGVVVDHETHRRVYLSGVTPVETGDEDVATQTREVLETIRDLLDNQGGEMEDVVRVRIFLEDTVETDFDTVHAVRNEFFETNHRPASTLVEVDTIVRGAVEIEAEAILPENGWTVETIGSP